MKEIFPFGPHIYRVPSYPLETLLEDMTRLKKLGFNTVKIQLAWAHVEGKRGELDLFEAEKLLEKAREENLSVIVLITLEQVPMWVWREYPDCVMVNALNLPHYDPTQYCLPSDGKPGPCWDHEDLVREAERFLGNVVKELSRYENVIAWNVWQEIGFWDDPKHEITPDRIFCYCDRTLRKFRKFLKMKYHDLDNLNRTWKVNYGCWEEVEPPRRYLMVPSWIDWRYFMDVVYIKNILSWRYRVVKENDPKKRPVMAHVDKPTIGSIRDEEYSEVLDIFGVSFYPGWIEHRDGCESSISKLFLHLDYVRSMGKAEKFWVGEFQGGQFVNGITVGKEPSGDDVKRWVLISLACGAQGMILWNHRQDIFWCEGHGFGFLEEDGSVGERAKELGKMGKFLERFSEPFVGKMDMDVDTAIVVSESLFHFTQATPSALRLLQRSIEGWYTFFWMNGKNVGFVSDRKFREVMGKYRFVVLPFPICMSSDLSESLEKFVRSGGVLISEASPGRFDEYGIANIPCMSNRMREIFDIRMCKVVGSGNGTKMILVDYGRQIKHSEWLEVYEFGKRSKPLIHSDFGVCGLESEYGKGRAVLIGSVVGPHLVDEENSVIMNLLLENLGMKFPKVMMRSKKYRGGKLLILINTKGETVKTELRMDDLIGVNTVDGRGDIPEIELEPFEIRFFLLDQKTNSIVSLSTEDVSSS
ncbi:MAG: beta-galactosidase [Thermotogae bacterium]|nr:beta-galactosidase [Thermotogota bacterium]